MELSKTLFALSFLLLSSGCSWNEPPVIINEPVHLDLPEPSPVLMTPVKWTVGNSLICVDTRNYEALSENMEKIQGHILLLREYEKAYRDYYEK